MPTYGYLTNRDREGYRYFERVDQHREALGGCMGMENTNIQQITKGT